MNSNHKFFGGVGLRPTHYNDFLEKEWPSIQWLEVISENYFKTEGRPIRVLEKLRETYPIACHGVSLNLASPEPLNQEYAKKIREFYKRIDPFIVSDHLCWTGFSAHNVHDLLPFRYDEASLKQVSEKLNEYQDFLGRQLCLENLSAYLKSKDDTFAEFEFMSELCSKTGCGMLFDVNNLYVNSQNFGFDAQKAIEKLPLDSVKQIHLAGYSDMGTHLFDTHSRAVQDPVWDLFSYVARETELNVPVMIEWDDDIPELARVQEELLKAQVLFEQKGDIVEVGDVLS